MKFITTGPFIVALSLLARTGIVVANPAYPPSGFPRALLARQNSGVPAECEASCAPVIQAISGDSSGGSDTSTCTAAFVNGYFACESCIGKSTQATDYSMPQQELDEIEEACSLEGVTGLPVLFFPGQGPSRPLATATPAPAPVPASAQPPATPTNNPAPPAGGDANPNPGTTPDADPQPSAGTSIDADNNAGADTNTDADTNADSDTSTDSHTNTDTDIITELATAMDSAATTRKSVTEPIRLTVTSLPTWAITGDDSAALRVEARVWVKTFGAVVIALMAGGTTILA